MIAGGGLRREAVDSSRSGVRAGRRHTHWRQPHSQPRAAKRAQQPAPHVEEGEDQAGGAAGAEAAAAGRRPQEANARAEQPQQQASQACCSIWLQPRYGRLLKLRVVVVAA